MLTFFVKSSNSGLTPSTALMLILLFTLPSMMLDRFSICSKALIQLSSIASSEIFLTMSGDMLISSTAGRRSFSTVLRFSSFVFRAVDRDCNVWISAETTPRSVWKLVREVSTDLRTSSQPCEISSQQRSHSIGRLQAYQNRAVQIFELVLFPFVCRKTCMSNGLQSSRDIGMQTFFNRL